MLRVQPFELIKQDSNHYVALCQTFDDRGRVEFTFNVELNNTNIGDRRELKFKDAFYFITHDDEAGYSLVKALVQFDRLNDIVDDTITSMLCLPSVEFRPSRLRSVGDSLEARSYEITFTSSNESVTRDFVVSDRGSSKLVTHKHHTWSATLNNVWWTVDLKESNERSLVLALVYFDWARNFEYTDAQLKERSEKILWDTIFLQSEKNDERRRQQTPAPESLT